MTFTGDILVRVAIPHLSGLAEDTIVNDLVYKGVGVDVSSGWGAFTIRTAQTYTVAHGAPSHSIGNYLGYGLDRGSNRCSMKVYDITGHLDGSPHGSPIAVDQFTLPANNSGVSPIPEEVALVATLRGVGWDTALVSTPDHDSPPDGKKDRPRQRHTGRLYLGPFNTDAVYYRDSGHKPAPDDGLLNAILNALDVEQLQQQSALGVWWSVWSRKNRQVYPVVRIEVDNAFDTQRRRGTAPSTRLARNA